MTRKQKEQLETLGYVKTRKDRVDGKYAPVDGVHNYMYFLMPNRCDAEVYQNEELDVTLLMDFIAEYNRSHPEGHLTLFHCVVTALAKLVKNRPLLNRFISGYRAYDRDKLTIGFVAKKKFADHSEESLMILNCRNGYTLADISGRIAGDVQTVRKDTGGRRNTADKGLDLLLKMPRWVNRAFVSVSRWADARKLYPASLMAVDTNYVSILVSNLGSIHCNACYHHLNNLGTNSIVVTIGEVHSRPVYNPDGSWEMHRFANFGFTLDERIADGFYFAKSVRLFAEILKHPETLTEDIATEVKYDV